MSRASVVLYRLAVVVGLITMSACAASERQRVISAGPVNNGPGSLEATRRQLAGTWTLTKFEVINAAGQLTAVRAKAQLTYDTFGNLSVKGVLEEPLPGQTSVGDAPALAYTGRATIDVTRKELILTGTTTVEPSPEVLASVGVDQRRKYEVTDSTLTMSILDSQGRMTSRATYRK